MSKARKVKVIEPKIKELKEIKSSDKESELEREVEETEGEHISQFISELSSLSTALEQQEITQFSPSQVVQRNSPTPNEPEFAMTSMYSTSNRSSNTNATRRAYQTQTSSSEVINPSLTRERIFLPEQNNFIGHKDELSSLRGDRAERPYEERFTQKEDKPKRRYPWEA